MKTFKVTITKTEKKSVNGRQTIKKPKTIKYTQEFNLIQLSHFKFLGQDSIALHF